MLHTQCTHIVYVQYSMYDTHHVYIHDALTLCHCVVYDMMNRLHHKNVYSHQFTQYSEYGSKDMGPKDSRFVGSWPSPFRFLYVC